MRNFITAGWIWASLAIGLCSRPTFANTDSLQSILPTAWLAFDYGLTTYKSQLIESNDTGGMVNYSIGANVGEEKTFGLAIRTDTSSIAFALNASKIDSTWRDTVLRWRWGYVYLGGVLGQTIFKAESSDVAAVEGAGFGYGSNFGAYLPVGKRNFMQLDVTSVTIGQFNDIEQRGVTFGPRTDVNVSGQIEIVRRTIHSVLGYRYRTHALKAEGVSALERHTATWVGLAFGADF